MNSRHQIDDHISANRPDEGSGGNPPHFVVAIGASAGGLEAIHDFFDKMPESSHLSFIIIQHLSPDYKSLLVDLVSRHTHMKVFEAELNLRIQRNCIYVIPNNKLMTLKGYKLKLTEKLPPKFPNNAVDVFMLSLAAEMKHQAIAIILSGTGTDGTKGIKAIKDAGGMVMVQEPAASKFDGMPTSAITTGDVDHVLTAGDMPQEIIAFLEDRLWNDSESTLQEEQLTKIFDHLRHQAGFDLNLYKTPTISRRLFHRMRKHNLRNVDAYLTFLSESQEECRLLAKDLLINVTKFFRDPDAYEVLKNSVIPGLLSDKTSDSQIKFWICACSTGEEAYSLAIAVDEVAQQQGIENVSVKFFATDVEQSNIDIAGKGSYPSGIANDVSPERLAKYFTKQAGEYVIIPRIRKQIIFAVHDVLRDPPFIRNHFVSCRNMLIYMGNALQERVYSLLLFSLQKKGHLFLGPTENPNVIKIHLKEIDSKWKIFEKISEGKVKPVFAGTSDIKRNSRRTDLYRRERDDAQSELWDDLKDSLLSEFNFAAFYVDKTFEIKEALGSYERILSLPKRVLRLNLARMLPGEISTMLVTEIKEAWKTNLRKTLHNLPLRTSGKLFRLQVVIQPEAPDNGRPLTFVAFQFDEVADGFAENDSRNADRDISGSEYVLSLEEELNETRNSLQHAVEDLQTTNEELQSSNEELLSANEELQSTNEELQSLNEELHTLNAEHQAKIRELIELNDDLNNYFKSSDIGQVIIDKNMIIRKFNPASVRMINLIEGDIGRPITHLSINVRYADFINDINRVQQSQETVEREVQLHNGLNLLLKIMPYVTRDSGVNGVVISFFDITLITNLNNIIRGIFNATLSAIFALKAIRNRKGEIVDFAIDTTNDAGLQLLGQKHENLASPLLLSEIRQPFFESFFNQFTAVVDKDQTLHSDFNFEDERGWLEVAAVKMMDGLVATYTDVTQKKIADQRLKKNYTELIATKEHLKALNADLEEKVRQRTKLLSESEERFRMVSRATNDVIWDWDIAHNRMWVSEAFQLQFGYHSDEETSRQQWMEKIHPDDRSDFERSIYTAINQSKTQWTCEYRLRKADGSYCNVLDRAYIMHEEFGMPYRMIGSLLDITNLKKAEQEIANNVAQRRFLAESMPLIVMLTAADGSANFINSQFETYTGIDIDQANGGGWKTAVHPADQNRLEEQWNRETI